MHAIILSVFVSYVFILMYAKIHVVFRDYMIKLS